VTEVGVTRLTRDGSPDPKFSSDGVVTIDFGDSESVRSVLIQPDGKIIVAGSSRVGNVSRFALARFTRSGSLDLSFGSGGRVLTDFGGPASLLGAAIQKDGRIVAAGEVRSGSSGMVTSDIALARYTRRGALDRSFGSGGRVVTDLGSGEAAFAAPAIQKDGKIVVAGSRLDGGDENFLVARYQKNGLLDLSFGMDGWTTTDFGGGDYAVSLTLQRDDRIVAAGTRGGSAGAPSLGAVGRYLGR
jgi:uncharacterized delta-60 repeat protein